IGGSITGGNDTGAFVGNMINANDTNQASGLHNVWADIDVTSAGNRVGGLAGHVSGTIRNSYTVSRLDFTGANATNNGQIFGLGNPGTASVAHPTQLFAGAHNSFAMVAGDSVVNPVIGVNTANTQSFHMASSGIRNLAEMTDPVTFAAWNNSVFDSWNTWERNIWNIVDGQRPTLRTPFQRGGDLVEPPTQYTITFGAGITATVGGASIDSGKDVAQGAEIVFSFAPTSSAHELTAWLIDGVPVGGQTTNTFMWTVTGTAHITVTEALIPRFEVTFGAEITATVGGDRIDSGDHIAQGTEIVFSFTPAFGDEVTGWYVNGARQAWQTANTFRWSVSTVDIDITVSSAPIQNAPVLTFVDNIAFFGLASVDTEAEFTIATEGNVVIASVTRNGTPLPTNQFGRTANTFIVNRTFVEGLGIGAHELIVTTAHGSTHAIAIRVADYVLRVAADMQLIRNNMSSHFILANDIDFEGGSTTQIGSSANHFTGVLDGNGFRIDDFTISTAAGNAGFFHTIGATGVVRNLSLGGTLTSSGSFFGALVHNNLGLIQNVFVDTTVNSTSTGTGGSAANFGGIMHDNRGVMENVIFAGLMTAANTAPTRVGLIAAHARAGTMTNVFAITHEDTASNIINRLGAENGNNRLAGTLIENPTLTNSRPITDAELLQAITFAAFDSAVWNIANGQIPTLISNPFAFTDLNVTPELEFVDVRPIAFFGLASDDVVAEFAIDAQGIVTIASVVDGDGTALDASGITLTATTLSVSRTLLENLGAGNHELTITTGHGTTHDIDIRIADFVIRTAANWALIGANLTSRFILANDINFAGGTLNTIGTGNETATATNFTGVLDGNGFRIDGFVMPAASSNRGLFHMLFGTVQNLSVGGTMSVNNHGGTIAHQLRPGGVIRNVFVDTVITSTPTSGNVDFGGITNDNFGTIENVIFAGEMHSTFDALRRVGLIAANGRTGPMTNVFAVVHPNNSPNVTSRLGIATAEANRTLLIGNRETGVITNSRVITDAELLDADTFGAFDTTIWHIVNGQVPRLRNPIAEANEARAREMMTNWLGRFSTLQDFLDLGLFSVQTDWERRDASDIVELSGGGLIQSDGTNLLMEDFLWTGGYEILDHMYFYNGDWFFVSHDSSDLSSDDTVHPYLGVGEDAGLSVLRMVFTRDVDRALFWYEVFAFESLYSNAYGYIIEFSISDDTGITGVKTLGFDNYGRLVSISSIDYSSVFNNYFEVTRTIAFDQNPTFVWPW
ncbi:MAG: hypothetical protein FWC80_02640, partial [Firmicutes bacterium]|nr:hypothetical protein [Bacillota bacterium]